METCLTAGQVQATTTTITAEPLTSSTSYQSHQMNISIPSPAASHSPALSSVSSSSSSPNESANSDSKHNLNRGGVKVEMSSNCKVENEELNTEESKSTNVKTDNSSSASIDSNNSIKSTGAGIAGQLSNGNSNGEVKHYSTLSNHNELNGAYSPESVANNFVFSSSSPNSLHHLNLPHQLHASHQASQLNSQFQGAQPHQHHAHFQHQQAHLQQSHFQHGRMSAANFHSSNTPTPPFVPNQWILMDPSNTNPNGIPIANNSNNWLSSNDLASSATGAASVYGHSAANGPMNPMYGLPNGQQLLLAPHGSNSLLTAPPQAASTPNGSNNMTNLHQLTNANQASNSLSSSSSSSSSS